MRKLTVAVIVLALVMPPLAAQASDTAAASPKLPITSSTEPLLPKTVRPEPHKSYACILGQVGGAALSLLLGSGKVWDALRDAALGHPPSAEQRAFCALGEALAPHVAAVADGVAEEAWPATQEIIASGSAHIEQAWAGLRASAKGSVTELMRECELSANCASLRHSGAHAWARLWPIR